MSRSSVSWGRGSFKGSSASAKGGGHSGSGSTKVASPHGPTSAQTAKGGAQKSTPKGAK
jgi:hypothetical protein